MPEPIVLDSKEIKKHHSNTMALRGPDQFDFVQFTCVAHKGSPAGPWCFYESFVLSLLSTRLAQVWSFRCGGPGIKHPAHCLLHVLPRALLDSCPGWSSQTLIRYHHVHRVFCLYEMIKVTFTTNVNQLSGMSWTDLASALTTKPLRFPISIDWSIPFWPVILWWM